MRDLKAQKRDHGGNLDAAVAAFGGTRADWIDVSTGINPQPYPCPDLAPDTWAALPTGADMRALENTAAQAYGAAVPVVPLAGAQAAIQWVPALRHPGAARVLGPTYNEHAGALSEWGWEVTQVDTPDALAGASLAVLVNPNNPCGRRHAPEALLDLAGQVGLLVVDESFADPHPELSVVPHLAQVENVLVLRSFGKFYGLAGLRLGFAIGARGLTDRIRALAGPWAVNGPAIAIGCQALGDRDWQQRTTTRLHADAQRLDALAAQAGWTRAGGTALFRTYHTQDATAAQSHLARHRIWSRIFPYSPHWVRLGLAGAEADWARLEAALEACT